MPILLPLMWGAWVSSIFAGFTFTDWYDFLPLGCLLLGLGCAVRSHFLVSQVSLWLKGVLMLLALWPLYPHASLLMLALQVVKVQGNWPQVMVDDPKNKMGLSADYDFWFHTTHYVEAFAGAALVSFVALMWANRERLSQPMKHIVGGFCVGAMLVAVLDPGHLFAWWLD